MTDGCGRISMDLARCIPFVHSGQPKFSSLSDEEAYRLELCYNNHCVPPLFDNNLAERFLHANEPPLACQVRIFWPGGIVKGVLLTDQTLPSKTFSFKLCISQCMLSFHLVFGKECVV